jgi:predicted TIM-barrel fold metal-dependent hydrolase
MDPGPEPFASFAQLLALAELPNVAVKCSGAAALSAEPYPFADLWPHLHALLEAFGLGRVMWGSDATRVASLHTYREALNQITETTELTAAEKRELLGGTARKLLAIGYDGAAVK